MIKKGYFKGLIWYVRLKIWTLSDKETLKDSRRFVDPTVHVVRPSNTFFIITKSPQAICTGQGPLSPHRGLIPGRVP